MKIPTPLVDSLLASAVLLALAFFVTVAISGCATVDNSNIKFEEGEQEHCKAVGCSVWTLEQLEALVRRALKHGYEAGYKAALQTL